MQTELISKITNEQKDKVLVVSKISANYLWERSTKKRIVFFKLWVCKQVFVRLRVEMCVRKCGCAKISSNFANLHTCTHEGATECVWCMCGCGQKSTHHSIFLDVPIWTIALEETINDSIWAFIKRYVFTVAVYSEAVVLTILLTFHKMNQ